MQTSVSMIPLTDRKRWIWPSNWPHRCPSEGNTAKWAWCLHTSLHQTKHKDTLTKNRISKTHTSQLCCLFRPWIPPKLPPLPPQPPPPPPTLTQTSTHANKQAGKQTVRAHTNCAYQGPGMTESVPAVLSPGKPSQDKPDGGLRGPAAAGAPGNWSHTLVTLQRVECGSYSADAAASMSRASACPFPLWGACKQCNVAISQRTEGCWLTQVNRNLKSLIDFSFSFSYYPTLIQKRWHLQSELHFKSFNF